jgi:hypothetical protein
MLNYLKTHSDVSHLLQSHFSVLLKLHFRFNFSRSLVHCTEKRQHKNHSLKAFCGNIVGLLESSSNTSAGRQSNSQFVDLVNDWSVVGRWLTTDRNSTHHSVGRIAFRRSLFHRLREVRGNSIVK